MFCWMLPAVLEAFYVKELLLIQAAMAHARTPMQMMAAKQQLMAAKSRQVAERMEFNCFN